MIRRVAFPSTITIVISTLVLATLGVGFSFSVAYQTLSSVLVGAAWGTVVLAVPSFVSSLIAYSMITKKDPLFYLRRCFAFSLFTICTWVIALIAGAVISLFVPRFVFPDSTIMMGLFSVVPMRALVVFSMSNTSFLKRILFTLIEPSFTTLSAIMLTSGSLWGIVEGYVLSVLVGLTFAFTLITAVELYGRREIGFSPIRMFRAFLTDWLEGDNQALESYLNELGVDAEIDAAAFIFRRKQKSAVKGLILVSNLHPGPFLNIGSSVLPFLFQAIVHKRLNAVGMVPHAASGHELNLVSQEQNERIISWVLANMGNANFIGNATPVVRCRNEIATATCQVFDGNALVTMTTAPLDMEDVPPYVSSRLAELSKGRFNHVAVIDAHNCLTGPTIMTSQKIRALEEVALSAMQSTATAGLEFRVGTAQKLRTVFTIKEGFGPGGISVIGIEVEGKRFAYINIDGNNMIKGLREEILDAVKNVGFDDAEVMTTDTHMVNGIISARLGYHMVGEVVPRARLLTEIIDVCRRALADLEPCEVGVISGQIAVTTLGSKSLRRIMTVVYRFAKLTALTLFPMAVAIAALSLLFLVV